MAGAIGIAAALAARRVKLTCPHCGHVQQERKPVVHRLCTRCRRHIPEAAKRAGSPRKQR